MMTAWVHGSLVFLALAIREDAGQLCTGMLFGDKAFVGSCGCKAYRMWRSLVLFFVASACYY